jgi:hypothetical protein
LGPLLGHTTYHTIFVLNCQVLETTQNDFFGVLEFAFFDFSTFAFWFLGEEVFIFDVHHLGFILGTVGRGFVLIVVGLFVAFDDVE